MFRESVRQLFADRGIPRLPSFRDSGAVAADFLKECAQIGMLSPQVPERYGGPGGDYRYNAIVVEEACRAGFSHSTFNVHSDVVTDYLLGFGTEAQKAKWLPGFVSGDYLGAICMTEPNAGSDLKNLRTRAKPHGERWLMNGTKTFITNGVNASVLLVAAITDAERGTNGISLFIVPGDSAGVSRGNPFKKIGMHDQDTAEVSFDDVELPADSLLGSLNQGYIAMQRHLPQERLSLAVGAVASLECAFALTVEHARSRKVFGERLIDLQNTRFVLADIKTELTIARSFVDECIWRHIDGELTADEAAMAKLWTTELQSRAIDQCVQLFGGYGYVTESPIAHLYTAARAQRIYGGSSEIMREIIGRGIAS